MDSSGITRTSRQLGRHAVHGMTATAALGWLQMYLITEYMQGGDLGGKLRSDKANPRQYGWYQYGRFILLGIIRGLVYLHSKRIVWFDCKPGNVLLDHTGRVAKIADFGMAKILESTFITGVLVSAMPGGPAGFHDQQVPKAVLDMP